MRFYPSSEQLDYLGSLLPEDMINPKKKISKPAILNHEEAPSLLNKLRIVIKKKPNQEIKKDENPPNIKRRE